MNVGSEAIGAMLAYPTGLASSGGPPTTRDSPGSSAYWEVSSTDVGAYYLLPRSVQCKCKGMEFWLRELGTVKCLRKIRFGPLVVSKSGAGLRPAAHPELHFVLHPDSIHLNPGPQLRSIHLTTPHTASMAV